MLRGFSRTNAAASHLVESSTLRTVSLPDRPAVWGCKRAPMGCALKKATAMRPATHRHFQCSKKASRVPGTTRCNGDAMVRRCVPSPLMRRVISHTRLLCPTVSAVAPVAAQCRCTSHCITPDGGGSSAAAAATTWTSSTNSRRRFANRRGPAKRVTVNSNEASTDEGNGSSSAVAAPIEPADEVDSSADALDHLSKQRGAEADQTRGNKRPSAPRHLTSSDEPLGFSSDGLRDSRDNTAGWRAGRRSTGQAMSAEAGISADRREGGDDMLSQGDNSSNTSDATRSQPHTSSSASSDLYFGFRLPPVPDASTATPASLCSYMLTLRRCRKAANVGNSAIGCLANRQLGSFLRFSLPLLVQPPPGGSPSSALEKPAGPRPAATLAEREGKGESSADVAHDAASGTDSPASKQTAVRRELLTKVSLSEQMKVLAGTGPVPWTTELAEATLLSASQADLTLSRLWVSHAAIQFLLHDAAHRTASVSEVHSREEGGEDAKRAVDSRPSPAKALPAQEMPFEADAQRVGEKARFAMAMLQTQQTAKRRARLREELLVPVSRMLLQRRKPSHPAPPVDVSGPSHRGAATNQADHTSPASASPSADRGLSNNLVLPKSLSTRSSSSMPTLVPQNVALQALEDLDSYLYDYLLPSLLNELRLLCEEMERRYDAAVSAATATSTTTVSPAADGNGKTNPPSTSSHVSRVPPPPSVVLLDSCLPCLLRTEQETFAVLLSVFYRILNQRGMIRTNAGAHRSENSWLRLRPSHSLSPDAGTAAMLAGVRARRLDGLPLRAFTITLASMALTMDRRAGPRSGLLERTLRLSSKLHEDFLTTYVSDEVKDGEGGADGKAGENSGSGGGSGDQTRRSRTPASPSTRFQQRRDSRDVPPSEMPNRLKASRSRPSAEPRNAGCERDSKSPKRYSSRARAAHVGGAARERSNLLPSLGNFNVEPLVSVLKFCYHEHALEILISTAGVRARRNGESDVAPGAAAHHTTQSRTEMYLEDYAQEIARACLTLLQVSLHWAPLCRTKQLPAVVHAVVRTLKYQHTSSALISMNVADEAMEPPEEELTGHDEATTATLDGLVHACIHQRFRILYPDATAFEKLTRRLLRSAFRYIKKQTLGSFVSTAMQIDQLFLHWPRALAESAARNPSSNFNRQPQSLPRGPVCYPVPASATTDVLLFSIFMEECWRRLLGQMFWSSIPVNGMSLRGGDHLYANDKITGISGSPNFITRERKSIVLRVWLSPDEEAGWKPEDAALLAEAVRGRSNVESVNDSGAFFCLLVPSFVLSWLSDHTSNTALSITPDMLIKLLRITDRIANTVAIPSSGSRTAGALSLLREWHSMPHARNVLSGSEELFLATQDMRLYVASMGLPTVLWGPASGQVADSTAGDALEGATPLSDMPSASKSDADARPSLRRIARRVQLSAQTILGWMTRINPQDLHMTPTGRLWSTSASPLWSPEKTDRKTTPTAESAGQRADGAGGEPPLVLRLHRASDSCILWLPTWRENRFSMRDVTTLLRSLLVMSVAEQHNVMDKPASGSNAAGEATSIDGGSGNCEAGQRTMKGLEGFNLEIPIWGPLAMQELLLRTSHRILFAPQDRAAMSRRSQSQDDGAAQESGQTGKTRSRDLLMTRVDAWWEGAGDDLFEEDPEAPLETLATLYLSLLAALKSSNAQIDASSSMQQASGDDMAAPHALVAWTSHRSQLALWRDAQRAHFNTAIRGCLTECERVLQHRCRVNMSESTAAETQGDEGKTLASAGASQRERTPAAGDFACNTEALLELSMLLEEAWPDVRIISKGDHAAHQGCTNTICSSTCSSSEASLPQQLLPLFQKELAARLRACSLQEMAAMLSNHLWWVTRQQQRHRAAATAAQAPCGVSWVEQSLLDALEESVFSTTAQGPRATEVLTAEAATSKAAPEQAFRQPTFEVYEWVLMPLYVQLELRRRVPAGGACLLPFSAAAAVRPPPALLDDFVSLEDAFAESDSGSAPTAEPCAFPSTNMALYRSPGAGSCRSTLLLEAALQTMVSHCESFAVLLHIVRYLFLSHPVTLTTAPDAAVQLNAAADTQAPVPPRRSCPPANLPARSLPSAQRSSMSFAVPLQANDASSLPRQWVAVPQSLRQDYVDTLYRLFHRLIYLPGTTLEDLFELLHVLWLADPSLSRPDSSSFTSLASGSDGGSGGSSHHRQRRSQHSAGGAAASQAWPSLFQRCADFVVEMLDVDLHDNDAAEGMHEGDSAGMRRHYNTSPHVRPPPVIAGLRTVLEKGLLTAMKERDSSGRPIHVASVQLPPVPVLLFLRSLATQARESQAAMADRWRDRGSGPSPGPGPLRLLPAQHALLRLLEPFVLHTVVTSEMLFYLPKATFLPLFLEVLDALEPRLVLMVIQAAFSGCAGPRRGGHRRSQGSRLMSSASGVRTCASQHSLFAGAADQSDEHARSVSSIVLSMMMVAHQAQASSPVWVSADSQAAEEEAQTHGAADVESAPGGPSQLPTRSSSSAAFYEKDGRRMQVDRAHQRAIAYLSSELYRHLQVARHSHPLRFTDPSMLLQLFQLSTVRSHYRLYNVLAQLFLRMLTTGVNVEVEGAARGQRGRQDGADRFAGHAGAARPSRSAPYVPSQNTDRAALSPVGQLLLRQLPLPQWRELFYRYIRYFIYIPYQQRLKLQRIRGARRRRDQRRITLNTPLTGSVSKLNEGRQGAQVAGGADRAALPLDAQGFVGGPRDGFSLATVLLTLDAAATRTLVNDVMSPSVLLTITADLLQWRWWGRHCSGREAAEGPTAITSRPSAAARQPSSLDVTNDAAQPPASSTYAVLLRYASANSVLREAGLQPFLKAACTVLDQLASANEEEFFLVLRREAAWRRDVKDGAARRPHRSSEAGASQSGEAAMTANADHAAVDGAEVLYEGGDEIAVSMVSSAQVVDIEDGEFGSAEDQQGESAGGDQVDAADSSKSAAACGSSPTKTKREGSSPEVVFSDPLLLDWQPIVRLLQAVYHVDPAVMERQLREAWLPHTSPEKMGPLQPPPPAQPQRDAFHDGIDAIIQRVGDVWREFSSTSKNIGKGGPSQQQQQRHPQRLLVMNLRAVLDMYSPYIHDDCNSSSRSDRRASQATGRLSVASAATQGTSGSVCDEGKSRGLLDHTAGRDTVTKAFSVAEIQFHGAANWLDADLVSSEGNTGGGSSSFSVFNDREASIQPLALGFRTTKSDTAATFAGRRHAVMAEMAKRKRRAARMQRAGMLMTAQEAEDRCAMWRWNADTAGRGRAAEWEGLHGGAAESSEGDADAYWRKRKAQVHQKVSESIFGVQESAASAVPMSAMDTQSSTQEEDCRNNELEAPAATDAASERQAHQRLELMRCEEVAQMLRLLLKPSDFDRHAPLLKTASAKPMRTAHATMSNTKFMQARILMGTLADLLPSAPQGEVVRAAQDLLQLYVDMVTDDDIPTAATPTTTPAHHITFEVRRLLSSIGVLLANDAERFSRSQLVWLLTRLHTPRLRCVAPLPTEGAKGDALPPFKSSAPTVGMALVVSESFLSAAVARTLTLVLADAAVLDTQPVTREEVDPSHTGADTAPAKGVVTVGQWMTAVSAAELQPSPETLTALLSLIEASAV